MNVVSTSANLGGSVAQAGWLGPVVIGHSALVLHSLNELGELLQLQCYNDSIINIISVTVVTTITVVGK